MSQYLISRFSEAITRGEMQDGGTYPSPADRIAAARVLVERCAGKAEAPPRLSGLAGEDVGVAVPDGPVPTSRAARFSSGLGLADFMKRMSVQRASAAGFDALAPAALRLAEAERLPAHARSITIRTNAGGGHDG